MFGWLGGEPRWVYKGVTPFGEEAAQCPVGVFWRLIGEEMAAFDGVAGDRLGVLAPHPEHVVAADLRAALAITSLARIGTPPWLGTSRKLPSRNATEPKPRARTGGVFEPGIELARNC